MATFRESETETIALIEWHRSCGRTVTRRTEQAMTEADACAAAHALIGQAHRRPYAGDADLKRLRRDALDAIVRHGLADVLAWLGEEVGPKPGVPTRAFLAGGVLLASHEFSARCKALSRKADSDA